MLLQKHNVYIIFHATDWNIHFARHTFKRKKGMGWFIYRDHITLVVEGGKGHFRDSFPVKCDMACIFLWIVITLEAMNYDFPK